jgi:hypothetical protein
MYAGMISLNPLLWTTLTKKGKRPMFKKRKKRKRQHKLSTPPLTLLRPRLDELLGDESWTQKDTQAIKTDLDVVCEGLQAPEFLPVLLKAYQSASAQTQASLDKVMPEWLNERGHTAPLLTLLKQHKIAHPEQKRARAWLKAAGVNPSAFPQTQAQTLFYQAHMHTDDSQGVIIILWYTNNRRYKVQGMNFLIDFNPPWEGAVKDIIFFPARSAKRALKQYVDPWARRDMPLQPLDATQAKREILKHLEANRREGIRLPRDLILARDSFLEHVLGLADTPETPPFTAEDFDELGRTGEFPEAISHFEQTVGRRVRMEDGQEIIVMGDPFEDEW